jgi:hypothetical protein
MGSLHKNISEIALRECVSTALVPIVFCTVKSIVAFRAVSRQRLGKHVPAATDTHASVFLLGPCKGVIRNTTEARKVVSRVKARSKTSTVALRVVGGDGKGSLEYETVKYGHQSHGTRTQK